MEVVAGILTSPDVGMLVPGLEVALVTDRDVETSSRFGGGI
jgi:hypothetical protein